MENTVAKPKSKRRWLRFSLRGLLVMVLVLGVGLGWLSIPLHRARQQRLVAEAILKLGGGFLYEHQGACERPPSSPAWSMGLLGRDLFVNVAVVRLDHADDADLAILQGLAHLQYLDLSGTHVTDIGLEHLEGFTQLNKLFLSRTQVTDAGLVHLGGLTQLECIFLEGTQLTDAGLDHLRGLSSLELLNLRGTQVTDAGVQELQKALPICAIVR